MNKKINSLLEQVKLLEELIEQQQAMLNFEAAKNNWMVDFAVKREKTINYLKSDNKDLEQRLLSEQDLHASLIKLAEQ